MLYKKILHNMIRSVLRFKNYCLSSFRSEKMPYRIVEIDATLSCAVIHCSGTRTFIKSTIIEIIHENKIIDGLPSLQACWLGYYYGKSLREGKYRLNNTKHGMNFLLRPSKSRYGIVALGHKDLKITYIDLKTREQYVKPVLDLAQDNKFLSNISSGQACYIGIWAGIYVAKRGPEIFASEPTVPSYLRIVK